METAPCRQEHMDCLRNSDDRIIPAGQGLVGVPLPGSRETVWMVGGLSDKGCLRQVRCFS